MKLTIIGAGPGGYETAVKAAGRGIEVTIISDGPVGGTCLNEGCIPTKSFCRNAEVIEEFSRAAEFGIDCKGYSFDFKRAVERKDEVVTRLRNGVDSLLKGKNITLLHGRAVLKDSHTVVVKESNDPLSAVNEGIEIRSDYMIIAVGSLPSILPVKGSDYDGVISSTELLDCESLPARLCVIGAGVIGLEFASIFKSFGSEVTVLEFCRDILPRFDTDMSKRLKQALVKRGISINNSCRVQDLSKSADGSIVVSYEKKGDISNVVADKVLMAVGRHANVGALNLADVGIDFTGKGIVVDENMETNVPNIYAIGDVVGGMMLAHVAVFQGYRALDHILYSSCQEESVSAEPCDNIDFSIVPAAVFTNPEAASVGMTEDECKAKGLNVKCLKSFFRANGKAVAADETDGFCKIIVAGDNQDSGYSKGEILGCHMFGAHSSDIIHEIGSMMAVSATIDDMKGIIHAHPTLSEIIQAAVQE
jgi:dihydrolipoamide dehydrogenase